MNSAKKAVLVIAAAGVAAGAGAGAAFADSGASGQATRSPGVVSGNVIQAPIHVPVNAVGNTMNVIGLLKPAFANSGLNG